MSSTAPKLGPLNSDSGITSQEIGSKGRSCHCISRMAIRAIRAVLMIGVLGLVGVRLSAQTTVWWDTNGNATGSSSGVTAPGTWDQNSTANWSTSSSGGATATWQGLTAGSGIATFSAGSNATGSYTVTVSGTVTGVRGVTFEEGTVNVAGPGTLTLGATSTIDTGANSAQIGAIIAGPTFGISKIGSGTLTLSGTNTYTGATSITAGTLSVSSIGNGGVAGNIGAATNAAGNLVLGGGTLQYTGPSATTNRNFTLTNATTSTIDVASSNLTISGASTATTGALTKTGAGTLTLGGTNLYTGLTTVNAGTLAYGVSNALANGGVTVSGGTLDLGAFSDTVGTVTLTGGSITGTSGVLTGTSYAVQSGSIGAILGGAVALTKTTSGTVSLSGTNTYTGVTSINAGTLSVATIGNGGVAGNLGAATNAAGNLVLAGGTLQYTGASASSNRSFTLSAGSTSTIDVSNAASTLTLTGASANVAGSLVKSGAGTLTLTGNNRHSGTTTVNGGTLNLNTATGRLNGTTAVTVTGGTLNVGDTIAANGFANRITISATLTLGGANGGGDFNLLRGSTTTGSQSLASLTVGAGTSSITGGLSVANTAPTLTFSGGTPYVRNVGGLVNITNANVTTSFTSAPSGAGNVATGAVAADNILIGATLNGTDFIQAKSGTASAATYTNTGTNVWTAGKNMTVNNAAVGVTGANINSLRFNNALASTVTQTGTTNITSGMILVTSNVGANTSTISGGTIAGASGKDLLVINNNTGGGITINSLVADNTSATGLTKAGAGALTLTNSNTYTGVTRISGGTLSVGTLNNGGVAGNLGQATSAAGNLVLDGGTLQYTGGTASTDRSFTITNGKTGIFDVSSPGANLTVTGAAATSTGALTKSGSGTLTLTGANAFSGAVTVTGGSLVAQNSSALGTGSLGTTVSGAGATLSLGNGITIGNGTLTLSGSGTTLNNKSGANRWTNDINVTNSATISSTAGTLDLGNNRPSFTILGHANATESNYLTIGNQTVTFSGTGTINVNERIRDTVGQEERTSYSNANTVAYSPSTGSSGNILVNMTGASDTVKFAANANSYTGSTTVQQGTLLLSTISNSAAPHDGVTDSFHAINGSLAIGTGSGLGATVRLTGNEQIAITSNINIKSDGVLDVNGVAQTANGLTLTGGTVNIGTGVLYLNNDVVTNASAQTATINAAAGGTLNLTLNRAGGVDTGPDATRQFTVASGSTPSGVDLKIAAVIEAGDVVKAGTGKMVFDQNNIYLGTTAVNAGILNIQKGDDVSYASGLGYGNGTFAQGTSVANGATLQLEGTSLTFAKEKISLIGDGYSSGKGALQNVSGSNTIGEAGQARINLLDNARINSDSGLLTIAGNIISTTAVDVGATNLNKALTVGGNGNVTISGAVVTGTGSTTTLTKDGNGTLVLSGTNGYQGATNINAGIVSVQNAFGLGSNTTGANGTFVANGAELQLSHATGISIGGESLSISGSGFGGSSGALTNVLGTNSYGGTITLAGNATIKANAGTLGLSGGITSDGTRALTIDVAGGSTVTASSAIDIGTITTVAAVPGHYAAGISSGTTGTLTKLGAGDLTFSNGAVSKLDGVTLTLGTMTVSGSGTIVKTGPLSAASTTTLTIGAGAKVESYYSNTVAPGVTFAGSMAGGGEFIKDGAGVLTFNHSFTATSLTLTLNGGTVSLLAGTQLEFGAIHITGDTILDFNGSANTWLKSAALTIDAGVTVTVNNWVAVSGNAASSSVWYVTSTVNAGSLSGSDITGGTPLNQITFTGWNSNNFPTTWVSGFHDGYFDHEIRPIPEPATYGLIFFSGTLGLLAGRRLLRRRTAARAVT